jgi:hypothetical protein
VTGAVAVLPVAFGDERPPQPALEAAVVWFRAASAGHWWPEPVVLAPLRLPPEARSCLELGGMGRWPRNSQALARDALAALGQGEIVRLCRAEGRLALVTAARCHPHAWHLRGGGVVLAPCIRCRRYVLLPERASLGAICHELGHLLLDWPDLAAVPGLGASCLMAHGAGRRGGLDPAPPCAPLRLAAGWAEAMPVGRATRLDALAGGAIGRFRWNGVDHLVELRRDGRASHLLLYETGAALSRAWELRLATGDTSRPLLAVLRPLLSPHGASDARIQAGAVDSPQRRSVVVAQRALRR